MKLTKKLLGYLNRVFLKDPKAFPAIQVRYAGSSMAWSVSDQILTLTPVGGVGHALSIDLSAYSLLSLAAFIAAQTGYTVLFVNGERANLSATVLLDSSGEQSAPGGDMFYGYTSLLWSYVEAIASELTKLQATVKASPSMMETQTSEGVWLDLLGALFGVRREPGENDTVYGQRIPSEVLRPKSNNVAIEMAIEQFTGQAVQVVNVIAYGTVHPLYDGSIDYDGSNDYSTTQDPVYGLFDVAYGYDIISGGDFTSFQATIAGIIERLRAAGTHLRALALQGSVLTDAVVAPTESPFSVFGALALSDTASVTDGTLTVSPRVILSDAADAPTDVGTLEMVSSASYSGARRYNGGINYSGGYIIEETIEGDVTDVFYAGQGDFSEAFNSTFLMAII